MTRSILIAGALSLPLSSSLFAQKPSPAKPAPAPTQTRDTHSSSSSKQGNESQYGNDIPLFDSQNETVEFMGRTYSLADTRLAGQFSSYLVQTPAKIEEAAKYRQVLREILDTLDRGTKGSSKQQMSKAYHLLTVAKKYPQDSGICESLQNSLAIARQSVLGSENSTHKIGELKQKYAQLIKSMDFRESGSNLEGATSTSPEGQAQQSAAQRGGAVASEQERARVELLAQMKEADLSGTVTERLGKWQFQAVLMQLFMQRRFEHCVIGCRFYNHLFNKGENQLKIKSGSELNKFFSDTLGVDPTVAGLDTLSNEMIGKSKSTADAVRNHIKRKQIDAATRRMIEAYVIGEHLTPIHTFDPDMRNVMHQYIMDSKNLKDSVEVKNWQEAEVYTSKLREQANDFRHIKAVTAIAGYKNASDLKVAEYKISMANQDRITADAAIKEATEYWPTNPLIVQAKLDILGKIAEEGDKLNTLKNKRLEFEGLYRTKDFRNLTITEAGAYQEYFNAAKLNERLPTVERDSYSNLHTQAKEVYDEILAITTVIQTAEGIADRSQHYEAWETIKLELNKDYQDKTKLREALNGFSSRASKFQDLFVEAHELEEGKNYGSALSCYLKAQTLFAKSKLAEDGIERLLADIE